MKREGSIVQSDAVASKRVLGFCHRHKGHTVGMAGERSVSERAPWLVRGGLGERALNMLLSHIRRAVACSGVVLERQAIVNDRGGR